MTLPDGRTRRPLLYEARHTAATLLLANGIDETTIKALTVYVHALGGGQ